MTSKKPPIVWYLDESDIKKREDDRLSQIAELMKEFEEGKMSLDEFDASLQSINNS